MYRCYCIVLTILSICTLDTFAQDKTWFKDITEKVGLRTARSGQISSCDINGDDYPDLLLQVLAYDRSMKTRLYLNRQDPQSSNPADRVFIDFTDSSGIYANRDKALKGRVADIWGIADINNDGYPDIVSGLFYFYVSTFNDVGDYAEVLLNDGTGRFRLVENSGLPDLGKFPATGICFLDYDLDGNLDIYFGNFSADHQSNSFLPGFLMKGNGDGTFKDVTFDAGLEEVYEPLYGASITDWNNDRYPDILTSPYCRTDGTLWKNMGNGTFRNANEESGYTAKNNMYGNIDVGGSISNLLVFPRELCQWEALPYDYDNDGDMDIAQMLIHGGLNVGEGRTTLTKNGGAANNYRLTWQVDAFDRPLNNGQIIRTINVTKDTTWSNQYGTFSLPKGAKITVSNYGHLGDQAGSWINLDNDMYVDFLLSTTGYDATNDRCYIQHQQPDHSFKEIAGALGLRTLLKETHSNRPLDIDLDGDDDFIIQYSPRTANAESGRVWVFQNDIANTNNHISIRLDAPKGVNSGAIGARVRVYAEGICQTRDVQSGVGRWGMMSPFILNFGLGKATAVDSVVVDWPTKTMRSTKVMNPPINKNIVINGEGIAVSVRERLELAQQSTIQLSPLPAMHHLTAYVPEQMRIGTMEIFSFTGELLAQSRLTGEPAVRVPMEHLAQGWYTLRIISDKGTIMATSFVKGQ